MHLVKVVGVALTAAGWAACSSDTGAPAAVEVSDSAGVTLITHHAPTGQRLLVGDAPLLVLGNPSIGGTELFRVRGALLLPDGDVVVADGGSRELLFFAPDGALQRRVGGSGAGPEEFGDLYWMQRIQGDSFVVYDRGNRRLRRFDHSGSSIATVSVRFEPERPPKETAMLAPGFPIGVAGDGRLLAVPWAVAQFTGSAAILPVRGELRSYAPDLSTFIAIDTVTIRTWYETPGAEEPMSPIPASPAFVFGGGEGGVAYANADLFRVTVANGSGVTHVVTEERARAPYVRDSLSSSAPFVPDSLPAYRALAVDSDQRLWLKTAESNAGMSEWRVVSGDMRSVDTIWLPTSALVLDAEGDRVLLLERDALGVETVVLRTIVR